MVPVTIRHAALVDMADLQGVFVRASLSNKNDRGNLLEHPEWLELPQDSVQEGRTRVAVDQSGALVGFAGYLISDGVAELEDLFVDPPAMRLGIGSALVRDIAGLVHELGFPQLEVTANPHAMAFYERMGFVTSHIVETEFYPALRMSMDMA